MSYWGVERGAAWRSSWGRNPTLSDPSRGNLGVVIFGQLLKSKIMGLMIRL